MRPTLKEQLEFVADTLQKEVQPGLEGESPERSAAALRTVVKAVQRLGRNLDKLHEFLLWDNATMRSFIRSELPEVSERLADQFAEIRDCSLQDQPVSAAEAENTALRELLVELIWELPVGAIDPRQSEALTTYFGARSDRYPLRPVLDLPEK